MSNIKLKRLTQSTLLVLVNGEQIGKAHQAPGSSRVYSTTVHGAHITALGQRDLIARIGDYLATLVNPHVEQLRIQLDATGLTCPPAIRTIVEELIANSDEDVVTGSYTQGAIDLLLNLLYAADDGEIVLQDEEQADPRETERY